MSGIWTTHIDPVTGMQYFYNMRYQVSKWAHQNTDFSYPPPAQSSEQGAIATGYSSISAAGSGTTTTSSSRVTSAINLKKRKGEGARIKLAVSRTKAGKHGRHGNTSSTFEDDEQEEHGDEGEGDNEGRAAKRERKYSRSRSRSLSQEQEQKTPRSRYEEELMHLNKGIEGTKGYGGPLVK
eukprot:gb/GECG01004564.1/.p1 GENE.gb/GECG01004564.1/~~gb/GECG01004564.1/.p1  ORF type:complete len:181 (+),score=25.40 gb/GECG01004564.1/:1-543(+)